MINEVSFLQELHTATKRDYFGRMNAEKPECMRVAKQYSKNYWDGDRDYGYGGFKYDGRYAKLAKTLIDHYALSAGDKTLDIGCGKAFLLYEMLLLEPSLRAIGLDVSTYALTNSMFHKRMFLDEGNCTKLPYADDEVDFAYSINVFHNLGYSDLKKAIREMVRVSKDKRYICVESYRNEEELTYLECWALTALSFYSPDDWKCILEDNGYSGDVEYIFFQ